MFDNWHTLVLFIFFFGKASGKFERLMIPSDSMNYDFLYGTFVGFASPSRPMTGY